MREARVAGVAYVPGPWGLPVVIRVYVAQVPLSCEVCGGTIEVGHLFRRGMHRGGGNRSYRLCRQCSPWYQQQLKEKP